jgi:hypothetical protein
MIEAWLSASEITASSSAQQRLEQAAVGVEAGGVEDGVLGAEERGDLRFQLLVQILRAADERTLAMPKPCVSTRPWRPGSPRVVGQPR